MNGAKSIQEFSYYFSYTRYVHTFKVFRNFKTYKNSFVKYTESILNTMQKISPQNSSSLPRNHKKQQKYFTHL